MMNRHHAPQPMRKIVARNTLWSVSCRISVALISSHDGNRSGMGEPPMAYIATGHPTRKNRKTTRAASPRAKSARRLRPV